MTNSLTDLSPAQLRKAASIKERIASLQKDLSKLLGTAATTSAPAPTDGRRKKRKMSKAAKAKLSAKLKAAWAKRKAGKK